MKLKDFIHYAKQDCGLDEAAARKVWKLLLRCSHDTGYTATKGGYGKTYAFELETR